MAVAERHRGPGFRLAPRQDYTPGDWGLDDPTPYPHSDVEILAGHTGTFWDPNHPGKSLVHDAPYSAFPPPSQSPHLSVFETFEDYLMYRPGRSPAEKADNIWVSLCDVSWWWSGDATFSTGTGWAGGGHRGYEALGNTTHLPQWAACFSDFDWKP